ncbi:MAG: hypothetical protein ACKPJF_21360 [Dolichospermum sp.]
MATYLKIYLVVHLMVSDKFEHEGQYVGWAFGLKSKGIYAPLGSFHMKYLSRVLMPAHAGIGRFINS